MTRVVEVEAPAKINLFLRVLGRRPDGYHDIETLFQSVSLADRVVVGLSDEATAPSERTGDASRPGGRDRDAAGDGTGTGAESQGGAGRGGGARSGGGARGPGGEGRKGPAGDEPYARTAAPPVQLDIDGPDLGPLGSNLAYRAARRFLEATGTTSPVRVKLVKRIPMGAGLGGGSSDAAAVLKGLAALTGFDDPDALHEMAADLGSDVPFFLAGSPLALGRGRGERLTELGPLPEAHLVLALPKVHVATAEAYAALAKAREGQGSSAAVSDSPDERSSSSDSGEWSSVGDPAAWTDVEALAHNDFEPVVVPRHEEIGASLEALRAAGASLVLLSGSGAASFGLFGGRAEAEEAAERLRRRHPWRFVAASTRTTVPTPWAVVEGPPSGSRPTAS